MKSLIKATAAITALMLIVSGTVSSMIPGITFFTDIPMVSAETVYSQYTYYFKVGDIELESEEDYSSLKKVSDYKEAYSENVIKPELKGKEGCRVAEVPVDVKYNSGFFTTVMDFIIDSELTLVGYKKNSNGIIQTFDDCAISTNGIKAICMRNATTNTYQTGTLFTLLIALPEKYDSNKKYNISINDNTFQLSKTTASSIWTRMLEPGSISIKKTQSSDDTDYTMEIGKTVKEYNSLKKVSQYINAYSDGDINGTNINPEYADYKNNKVIEVPMNITKNPGVNTATIKFDCDPNIKFMGCLKDQNGNIISIDSTVNYGINTKKILINNSYKNNCVQTGTLVTMLFILPDDVKYDYEYKINFKDNGFNFVSGDPALTSVSGIDGYAMVTAEGKVTTTSSLTESTKTDITTKITSNQTQKPASEITTTQKPGTSESTTKVTTPDTTKPIPEATTSLTTVQSTKVTTILSTTEPTQSTSKVTAPSTTKPTQSTSKVTLPSTTESTKATTPPKTTDSSKSTTVTTIGAVTTVASQTQVSETTPKDIEIPVVTDINDLKNDRVDSNEKIDIKAYPVKIKCDDISVIEGMKISPVSVNLKDFNTASYFHEAVIEFKMDERFTVSDIQINFNIKTDDTKYEINGNTVYLYGIDTTKLSSDTELFELVINAKESTPIGKYDVNINASAKRAVNYVVDNGVKKAIYKELSTVNGEESIIDIKQKSVVIKEIVSGSVKITNPDVKFYYSHSDKKIDSTGLKVKADIVTKYNNGQVTIDKEVDITNKLNVSDKAVPSKLYNKSAFKYAVDITYTDAEIAPEGKIIGSFDVLIGQLGDVTLNHDVDVVDSTIVIRESAKNIVNSSVLPDILKESQQQLDAELIKTFGEKTVLEFMRFLANTYLDTEGEIDVVDSTLILRFAALAAVADVKGEKFNVSAEWTKLLSK